MVYDSSSEDMAFSIGGELNIYSVSRKSFEQAARDAGIGVRMAMNRFDVMAARFEAALQLACETLVEQGFEEAGQIREEIMNRGGIRNIG